MSIEEFEKYNKLVFEEEPDLREWFFKILPVALNQLKKEPTSLPNDFLCEELKKHKKEISEMEFSYSKRKCKSAIRKRIISRAQNRWNRLLDSIINHCKESVRETSSFKWKYKDDWKKAWDEFYLKYGYQGEKLEGNWGKRTVSFGKNETFEYETVIKKYKMEEMNDRNKELTSLFNQEIKKAERCRKRHQKKALELFVKYFNYFCCESELNEKDILASEQGNIKA